jgi:hypothetical protein
MIVTCLATGAAKSYEGTCVGDMGTIIICPNWICDLSSGTREFKQKTSARLSIRICPLGIKFLGVNGILFQLRRGRVVHFWRRASELCRISSQVISGTFRADAHSPSLRQISTWGLLIHVLNGFLLIAVEGGEAVEEGGVVEAWALLDKTHAVTGTPPTTPPLAEASTQGMQRPMSHHRGRLGGRACQL